MSRVALPDAPLRLWGTLERPCEAAQATAALPLRCPASGAQPGTVSVGNNTCWRGACVGMSSIRDAARPELMNAPAVQYPTNVGGADSAHGIPNVAGCGDRPGTAREPPGNHPGADGTRAGLSGLTRGRAKRPPCGTGRGLSRRH